MPIFNDWYGSPYDPVTGEPMQPIAVHGPDTTIHAVLTLFTCGLWLPIWIIAAITGKKRIEYARPPRRRSTG